MNKDLSKKLARALPWLGTAFGLVALAFLFGPLFQSYGSNGAMMDISLISLLGGGAYFSLGFLFTLILLLLGLFFSSLGFKKKEFSTIGMILYFVAACFLIASPSFYDYVLLQNGLNADGVAVSAYGLSLIVSAVFIFLAAFGDLISVNRLDPLSIGEIGEMAVLVALAVVLDIYVSIDIGPTGGSFNFCIIPLYVIALRSGPAKGFIAGGIVFGFITCLTDGYGLYYYPFDYLIGWGSIGIIGFFRKFIFDEESDRYNPLSLLMLSLALLLSTLIRMIGGTVSSIVFYGFTFYEGMAYNATYCLPTMALGFVVMVALYKPLSRLNRFYALKRSSLH